MDIIPQMQSYKYSLKFCDKLLSFDRTQSHVNTVLIFKFSPRIFYQLCVGQLADIQNPYYSNHIDE